ncbi:O-methyltransferase [Garciella nitratireducens]|uniref:O-methyltransferase n=1 Tax=Garciella nitratireducens TaxID=218205 RepID=UPI001BD3BB9D
MSNINQEYIQNYIRSLLPKPSILIQEMECFARENHIPIVQPEVAQFIVLILQAQRCKKVLEIGTAIGYSSILWATAMGKGSKVVTIERESDMIFLAKQYVQRAQLQDNIKILQGQGEEVVPILKDHFDCIFLDAAKGHYMDFLPSCLSLLKTGGLLISDNVLFRGMVASDALVNRRKITIVKRMRKYLECISNHPQLITSVIPIGDGLAISLKKE